MTTIEKFKPEERQEYLKEYGSFCMAYSTLQSGMNYFDVPGIGYITYIVVRFPFSPRRTVLAFFDPVCKDDKDVIAELISRFLNIYKSPVFIQIHRKTADILNDLNFFITQFGVETAIPVQSYKIAGNKKSRLKEAYNRANKKGKRLRELQPNLPTHIKKHIFDQLKALSQGWMETRKVRDTEVKFITRPAVYEDEEYVRKFYIQNESNEIEGFSFYDPIFSGGTIIGYTPAVSRFSPTSFKGINYFTNIGAINHFREENIKELNLGLSPFYSLKNNGFKSSHALNFLFSKLYDFGEGIYNTRGLAEHKRQYRGIEAPVFIASKKGLPLSHIFCGFRACNII